MSTYESVVIKNLTVTKLFKELYYITIPSRELDWGILGIVEVRLGATGSIKTKFVYILIGDYYYILLPSGIARDYNFENRVVKMKFYRDKPLMIVHSSSSYFDYLADTVKAHSTYQPPSIPKGSSELLEFECKVIVNKNGLHKLKPITRELDVGWQVGDEVEVWFFKEGKFEKGLVRRVNKLFNRGEAVAIQFTRKQAEKFGLVGKKKVKCIKNIPEVGAVTIVVD